MIIAGVKVTSGFGWCVLAEGTHSPAQVLKVFPVRAIFNAYDQMTCLISLSRVHKSRNRR